ncbi:MAG: hypothetical protein ACREMA_02350 [Longimicrobiales bacterium]
MRNRFSYHIRLAAGVLLPLGLSACVRENTGTDDRRSGQVSGPRIVNVGEPVLDRAAGRLNLILPVTIKNTLPESVYYMPCATSLARREGSEWKTVWRGACSASHPVGYLGIEVRQDSEHKTDVRIWGTPGIGQMDYWTEPVAGEYRITVFIRTSADALSMELSMSEPFELREK